MLYLLMAFLPGSCKSDYNRISVGWNNRVLKTNLWCWNETHAGVTLFAMGFLPLIGMARKRNLYFMSSLLKSSTEVIRYVSSVLGCFMNSLFFSSIREIQSPCGVSCRDSPQIINQSIRDLLGALFLRMIEIVQLQLWNG